MSIVGTTDARIPWPVGQTTRAKSLVLYGDLVKAVRRESSLAVQHWWGVSPSTVWKWRRALDVDSQTEGDPKLLAAYGRTPMGMSRMKAMHAKGGDPVRRAKIAAAKLGKPRPKHVIEALRKANIGRHPSRATRQKMSAAHKRRGTGPPKAGRAWGPWEDVLVRTEPAPAVAKRTGRTLSAVYGRRHELRK